MISFVIAEAKVICNGMAYHYKGEVNESGKPHGKGIAKAKYGRWELDG